MKKDNYLIYIFGIIPVIWLGVLIAPISSNGLFNIIEGFSNAISNPFNMIFCKNTIPVVFIFVLVYVFGITIYLMDKKNYRRREEHGSAKWGNVHELNKRYSQIPFEVNKILSKNFSIGYDAHKHMRNLNTIVIGGSGAGKTRFYAKPNVMQANTSFVILDPKGEITRAEGNLLKQKGYEVKVLDLINMEKSHCYNPFVYIKDENDVQRLVTNLFKSTTPKGSTSQDPFWDTAASMLLSALIFYLKYEAPEEEQNFSMVMEMIRAGDVKEDDDYYVSPLDMLFNELEAREPDHIAIKYYKGYKSGAGKTLKSIQITLISRLEKFNLDSMSKLTQTDELDLGSLGEKKVALFAIIPDTDKSFNFIVSILYTQLFQQLFYLADNVYNGALPVHVHFLMDEFANVSLPDDFENILSTMRSRNVSVSIILQNLTQLKALFEKQWESIVGNSDTLLYLGGNEQETFKFLSNLMGKETIDTNTYGKTSGLKGNYSTNYQITGRELLTPDEVRMINNKQCVLFIRGERPIIDLKFNIKNHPNINFTPDGNGENYYHGTTNESIGEVSISLIDENTEFNEIEKIKNKYEVIYSEEIDDFLERKGKYERKRKATKQTKKD